jgi:hypothetical protein
MCCGECGKKKNGNFTYVRFASDENGTDLSKYIHKDNDGNTDTVERCFQSIFVSPIELDEDSPLFPGYFTEWIDICDDCGCDCEWFDYKTLDNGDNGWGWGGKTGSELTTFNTTTYNNEAISNVSKNGDVFTIPFFTDENNQPLESSENYCFQFTFNPSVFLSSSSSVSISFGDGVGATVVTFTPTTVPTTIKTTITAVTGTISAHTMIIRCNHPSSPGTQTVPFDITNFRLAPEECCSTDVFVSDVQYDELTGEMTVTYSDNSVNVFTIGGNSDLVIANCSFVSEDGDDSTGEPGSLTKRFATISGAIDGSTPNIVIFPGNYSGGNILDVSVESYTFLGKGTYNGFRNVFGNLGNPIETKIYAKGWKFQSGGSITYLTGANPVKFYFEFDEIISTGSMHTLTDLTNTDNQITLRGKRSHSYIYGLNPRSASNVDAEIDVMSSDFVSAIFVRPGSVYPSGRVEVKFKDIFCIGGETMSFQQLQGIIIINGKIKTPSAAYLMLVQGDTAPSKLEIDIEMEIVSDNMLFYSNFGAGTDIVLSGIYKTTANMFALEDGSQNIWLKNFKGEAGTLGRIAQTGFVDIENVQLKGTSGDPMAADGLVLDTADLTVKGVNSVVTEESLSIHTTVAPYNMKLQGLLFINNGLHTDITATINPTGVIVDPTVNLNTLY